MKTVTLLTAVLLAPLVAICAKADVERQAADLQTAFVWSPSAPTGKQVYAVFRKTFALQERPAPAVMRVFADSRYLLTREGITACCRLPMMVTADKGKGLPP